MDLDGRASSGGVGLAEFHTDAFDTGHPTFFVADDFGRVGEHLEVDTFFFGVVHFLAPCRQFGFGAAVDDGGVGSQPLCGAHGVHGHVPPAYDNDAVAGIDRGVVLLVVGVHEVGAGQEFIGRNHAVQVLAGNAHKPGQPGAGADEYGFEALFVHQLVDGHGAPDDYVGLDLYAEFADVLNLRLHDAFLGQTKFGNAVFEYAAGPVEHFKNGHLISQFR